MKSKITKYIFLTVVSLSTSLGMCFNAIESTDTSLTIKSLERPMNQTKTNDFGLGAKWGSTTGINLKYWISEYQAWDFTTAFVDNNTTIGIDYIIHFRNATEELIHESYAKNIVPYVGVGFLASMGKNKSSNQLFDHENNNGVNTALKVPFGIEYLPTKIRLGLFAELGLGLGIAPKTFTFATADLGGRFYF